MKDPDKDSSLGVPNLHYATAKPEAKIFPRLPSPRDSVNTATNIRKSTKEDYSSID
jgi:hypothetical protein